ncbi:hypothetical protein [Pseudovibrio sp. Tun.PSC04-5.I4]|uniref:hypothetical protein n=1 Tax=Pseudovibrio sp. Tun.PSC04-5.I4 TaxID=1798213 RepID=UPI0008835EC4|nr:hypothetical protein [Pseudovibrio sp. Tun.PSC04-5.I4]SDQ22089.1 hypothetical protein SAMN04515695_0536 [Pseudovibrio sp. Tun.PSC04-5.I4]
MINRRSLLMFSGALITAPALGYGGALLACRSVPRNTPAFFANNSKAPLKLFGEAVVRYAKRYASFSYIEDELNAKPLLVRALQVDCPTTQAQLVGEQCRLDFAEGDCLVIDNMVVSRTEALICASLVS